MNINFKKVGLSLSAAAMTAGAVLASPHAVLATNVADVAGFNDGIGGISTFTTSYDADNDITIMDITARFDDAALETVLNQ